MTYIRSNEINQQTASFVFNQFIHEFKYIDKSYI